MATSLAEQLKRLAVPQTSVLKQGKKRVSLLFDPKDAAGLKRDTVYHIGLEGLEELLRKNEAFQQFEGTLFHITSKDFDRSIQNSEANQKLDKNIRKFLLLLSPYFLLNCAHKALEWLINRYSINEYNRDDLLMLILPYHESNVFVRVLQLLRFNDSKDSFFFLKALQKPGVHLPKQTLLNHAATNSIFLKCITRYVLQLVKCHEKPNLLTTVFNFYCAVFAGTIEYSENITEDQVSQMLPALLKGLNSPIADFCAASYVIAARLVTKTSLSEKLLNKFVEKISELKVSGLEVESCLVLIVLYQSCQHYVHVPPTAIANLSEKEWFPKVLANLNESGSFIYPFLEKLVKKCTEEGTVNDFKLARHLITNFLDEIKLDESFVAVYLCAILDAVRPKMKYSEEAKTWLIETVQTMEKQYPNAFDREIYKILSLNSDKQTNKRRKTLSKILKQTTVYGRKFDIFEKLYHSNPQIRGEATNYLVENVASFKETDRALIKNALIDRLCDDSIDVVQITLKVIQKIGIVENADLKGILIKLAYKCIKHKIDWGIITNTVVNLLINRYEPNDWEVFLAIFPFLLPLSAEELVKSRRILKSSFILNHVLFQPFAEKLQSTRDTEDFIKIVLKVLKSNTNLDVVKDLLVVLNRVSQSEHDLLHDYLSVLILTTILPKRVSLEDGSVIVNILISHFEKAALKMEMESSVVGYIEAALADKFPVQGYLQCLKNTIHKILKPDWNLKCRDFSANNSENDYFIMLSKFLVSNNNAYTKQLSIFLDYFCTDLQCKIEFLLNLCISENKTLDSAFKNNVVTYIRQCLTEAPQEETKQLIYIDKPTTGFLLVLLSHDEESVRRLIFETFDFFIEMSTRKSNSFFFLLEYLQRYKDEIVIDHEQICLIMFNVLDPSHTKGKKHAADLNSIRNHLTKLAFNEESPTYLKVGILKILSHSNNFEILEETTNLVLGMLQSNPSVIKGFDAKFFGCVVNRIDSKVVGKVQFNTNAWKFIESCIKNDETVIYNNDENQTSPSLLILNQIDKDVLPALDVNILKKLVDCIIEIASTSQNAEILPAARRIFKHMDLDAELILDQLRQMREVQSPKQDLAPRKRRVSTIPTVDILDTLEWKKGVTVLEFIQDKKKIKNLNGLLQVLFEILKRCLDFDEQAAIEYPKQLILSSILHCCQKGELPEKVFNMELIVQCIRASQNPQTHHHALLLLAHTAHLIPGQVLHNMMAIFTFMGSSVLRHDDAYSFQIISRIIDTVIPILVKENKEGDVAKVLRVFVDAILDVPEHRRMPLYKQLLEKIDARENLFLFLLIIFESQILHSSQEKQNKDNSQKRLDIAANLCREFSPDTVIYTCIKLIKYLQSLPDEKQPDGSQTGSIDITTHTPKDFRHYKYLLLKFTSTLLGSEKFVNQVAALSENDELALENLFKEIIVNILQYVQRISKVAEKSSNTPQAQYWKVVLHLSYDILDSVNALITSQMFLLVTKGLMVHNLSTVRRRVLELLNTKLQNKQQFFADCDKNGIYTLLPPIISIIETIRDEPDAEQETIIQTALLSLKLLVKSLAREDPDKFVLILEFIVNVIKSGTAKNNVLASLVLCLAELCTNLKVHAIASLPDFMPAIIKILKKQKQEQTPSVLLRSIITAVEKIFDSMPLFLSPYLVKLLTELCMLLSKWDQHKLEPTLQAFIGKVDGIKRKIGNVVPIRILLPAVEQCYSSLVEKTAFQAINPLMDILAENFSNIKGPEINSGLTELSSFFLSVLEFRVDHNALEEADLVESHIVKALTVLILKLSESNFRPFYYKLYDWAVRSEVKSERLITFYSLSSGIAHSLKGLFVLFAGHFLNNSAQILDSCNKVKYDELYYEEESKNILLLESVLKTLNAVFLYDNQKFINKERFNVLMQPLVDQLENTLGGLDQLVKRNEELLTPCLVHFSVAVADDALWKQMNYQILLKMRNNLPGIRLVSLHCLTEIVKKLGEDFLPLLPETIPFLAELLEDEEESVEKACQRAVQEMEKVLGEPLQKYF